MHDLADSIRGAVIMGCFLAAVFFVRYWRLSRDRFYGFFTAAMLLLAANWVFLVLYDATGEQEARHVIYLLRLAAFLLIVAGIIDKNRRSRG